MNIEKPPVYENVFLLKRHIHNLLKDSTDLKKLFLETWQKTEKANGIAPPGKAFILAMVKEKFGVSFTKDEYLRLPEDLRYEIFKEVLSLTNEMTDAMAASSLPAEPEETHFSAYEKHLKRQYAKDRDKESNPERKTNNWDSFVERSLPPGDRV